MISPSDIAFNTGVANAQWLEKVARAARQMIHNNVGTTNRTVINLTLEVLCSSLKIKCRGNDKKNSNLMIFIIFIYHKCEIRT